MVLVCGQNCAWQLIYSFKTINPGKVNRVHEVHRSAAGKGVNVARALTSLGTPVTLLAYLGGSNGQRIHTAIEKEGTSAHIVRIKTDTRTCVTLIEKKCSSSENKITEIVEPAAVATGNEQRRFTTLYEELLKTTSAVVIAGTAIGGADKKVYSNLIRLAHERGIITVLDAYSDHALEALAAAPSILKINRSELANIAMCPVETEDERIDVYHNLRKRYGVQWVIITGGSDGIEAFDGHVLVVATVPSITLVNSIGSGDAATAGLMKALAVVEGGKIRKPLSLREADLSLVVRYAAASGTANCLSMVPGSLTLDTFEQLCQKVNVSSREI